MKTLATLRDVSKPKKIVYLFGAGATHAELSNYDPTLIAKGKVLLMKEVSRRVIEKARLSKRYLAGVDMVSGTGGSLNIESLISLIENSKIHDWEFKARHLKRLVRKDIEGILTTPRTTHFYLHKALVEFHTLKMIAPKERAIGLISLNYDSVLDAAYQEYWEDPNYCFSLEPNQLQARRIPLLKLHGSFNWSDVLIRGRQRTIEIIPFGSNKNYLHAPYSFIWNRALEVLVDCDILRVIGCSLSPNDAHLIDLLFKAHLERGEKFDIEIIDRDSAGEEIRKNYGFLPAIRTLTTIPELSIPERDPDNAFKTWLKYKSLRMLKGRWKNTKYLKAVVA